MLACTLQIDAHKRVRGYRMRWSAAGGAATGAANARALLACLARQFESAPGGWQPDGLPVHLGMTVEALFLPELLTLPSQGFVVDLAQEPAIDEGTRAMLGFLREQGFGVMLGAAAVLQDDGELLRVATHLDVGAADQALLDALREKLPEGAPGPQFVASRLAGWDDFARLASQQVDVFADGAHGAPPVQVKNGELQPEAAQIVHLMQMVKRDERMAAIETALKHDAAITYRLLRHMNSPAVGAGVQITSMRHAVTMLGYTPLLRWLALLLATSNGASAPYMMRRSILRGRFAELLGRGLLPDTDSDGLFVAGMFSLIDQLLGLPMAEVMDKLQLSDMVQKAIVSRQGVYGPFIALVEACEHGDRQAGALAEALFVGADEVNAAHLHALAWSQEVSGAC
ncbi:EAL and HDOD domain-containing protein [Variovorax sp.]|uniref:EAL and HDOD domain-containing protein n=1 Tax=Variovorax sp. TaxID=1871043 RepID=UPI002D40F084|nr:HDOD domain-containing protein [Variovorax sp.]HYP83228.1 HDOD domain-containing protein [Variovorax sp.]